MAESSTPEGPAVIITGETNCFIRMPFVHKRAELVSPVRLGLVKEIRFELPTAVLDMGTACKLTFPEDGDGRRKTFDGLPLALFVPFYHARWDAHLGPILKDDLVEFEVLP